eukprot:5020870-Prymnesium_polylepis.1
MEPARHHFRAASNRFEVAGPVSSAPSGRGEKLTEPRIVANTRIPMRVQKPGACHVPGLPEERCRPMSRETRH